MKYHIITFILFLSVSIIFAQVKISGTLKDATTDKLLDFATVSLLTSDSILIKGVSTDDRGIFVIDNVPDNRAYLISASFLGYETTVVQINPLVGNIDLGIISCSPIGVQLDDITVTANSVIRKTDRQVILPTEAQVRASNNGMSLLKNLQLPRLVINPIDNSVSLPGGESVQLRINGVEVSKAEIISLNPSEILKIEYHDNPGLRYNNAGAVIDYILRKRESGGNVSTDLSNGISDRGFGDNQLSARYNYKNSEFSTNVYWRKRDIKWIRENNEEFYLLTGLLKRTEIGMPTKAKSTNLNFSLNYSLQKSEKYLFNLRFRNNHENTPNNWLDRKSILYQEGDTLSINDHSTSQANIPSLDLYYQQNLENDQQLIFNVVGTYMYNKNSRIYQESRRDIMDTDILSDIRGRKYSLITEGVYVKQFEWGKLSGGIKHTQTYTKNEYRGTVNSNVGMNTAETYGYVELSYTHRKFTYMFGLGEMRTYNSQDNRSSEKYIIRPTLNISYNVNDNLFFRYNGYISGYAPSLSDLNNVEQPIDSIQIQRGNPNLRSVRFFVNTLTASWNKGIFGAELFARYSYDDKPIMESVFLEKGKVIRTSDNQKGFHRINSQLSLRLNPYKDYFTLSVIPFFNRYISNGNTYTRTYSNWGIRASMSATYKQWTFMADINTGYKNMWGETREDYEHIHSLTLGYNTEKWSLSVTGINVFTKYYDLKSENYSAIAPYKKISYSNNLTPVFLLNFSFNFNFGRKYDSGQKILNNEDSTSGILSGKK